MASYSVSLRLSYQAAGENLNAWGLVLNTAVFQPLEDAVAGSLAFSLSGTKTLIVANDATDEAHFGTLNITGGTGGTVTAPAVKKTYLVRNGSTGDVVVTAGGLSATVKPGQTQWVWSDGTDFRLVQSASWVGSGSATATFSGYAALDVVNARVVNVGSPTAANDAANKAYVDSQAWGGTIGAFPGLPGNAGRSLVVNAAETAPQWDGGPEPKTANFTAARGGSYSVNTTSGVVTALEPPGSVDGDVLTFADGGSTAVGAGWAGNRFVFDPGSHTVMGSSGVMNCRIRGAAFSLTLQSGDWKFI